MSDMFEIPGKRVILKDDPCPHCKGLIFVTMEDGPHVRRQCVNCGEKLGFIKRDKVDLPPREIKREPIDLVKRAEILQRWNHRCAWCGVPASAAPLVVGHILPRGKMVQLGESGLADNIMNLAPSCEACNAGAHLTSRNAVNLLLASIRMGVSK